MFRRKSKTQFVKQERNMQKAIVFVNYLKRIAPQQLMLKTQIFTKKNLKLENATAILLTRSYILYIVGRIPIFARF
jgi:uncharacterized membrane protein YvbJ